MAQFKEGYTASNLPHKDFLLMEYCHNWYQAVEHYIRPVSTKRLSWLQVIIIDEAQFFPDLHEFCCTAADEDAKTVIVAGLSGDFRRQKFGQVGTSTTTFPWTGISPYQRFHPSLSQLLSLKEAQLYRLSRIMISLIGKWVC